MRGFAAVFRREIAERRLLAVFALLGLLPLALPWIGGAWMGDSPEARGAVAVALALISGLVLAVLLGASVMAPELAERRLGFYFSRPIGAGAVWAGKLAAAFVLALAGALAIVAPTWLVERRITLGVLGTAAREGLQNPDWLLILLLVVLASHAVSVMVRARSPWLLADVAGAAAVALLVWEATGRLRLYQAAAPLSRLMASLPSALLAALLVATALQVARGRADLRRSHRVLSLSLWGLLLAAALGAGGYSRWVLAVGPEDIAEIKAVLPAPAGTWFAVTGPAAGREGYEPGMLVDVSSGRFLRLGFGGFAEWSRFHWSRSQGSGSQWSRSRWSSLGWNRPQFSADGRRAVWLEWRSRQELGDLVYADLGTDGGGAVPSPVATGLSFPASVTLALSPDSRLVAAATADRLLVHELESGRLVASVALRFSRSPDLVRFVGPGRIWLYRNRGEWGSHGRMLHPAGRFHFQPAVPAFGHQAWSTDIREVDLATGRLAKTDPSGRGFRSWGIDSDSLSGRLVFVGPQGEMADLSAMGAIKMVGLPRFLADGRIVFAADLATAGKQPGGQGMELRLLDHDGSPLAAFPFPGARSLAVAGEPGPGQLVVASSNAELPASTDDWEVKVLDLATGAVRTLARGLAPAPWLLESDSFTRGPLLFTDRNDELILLDPGDRPAAAGAAPGGLRGVTNRRPT